MKNYKVPIQAIVYITYDVQAENEEQAVDIAALKFKDDRRNYTVSSDDITIWNDEASFIEVFEPEEQ